MNEGCIHGGHVFSYYLPLMLWVVTGVVYLLFHPLINKTKFGRYLLTVETIHSGDPILLFLFGLLATLLWPLSLLAYVVYLFIQSMKEIADDKKTKPETINHLKEINSKLRKKGITIKPQRS